MTADRHLPWEGLYNARDLGGLRLQTGEQTRWGTTVRADSPARLTATGWAAVQEHGVRTIIDLRNTDEIEPDDRPADITTVHVALDDSQQDKEFWDHWGVDGTMLVCTPLYYAAFLDRFPQQIAKVCTAIARAEGGVMFHCAAGRDRTGLISLVLLALAGVDPEDIAADHALSTARLKPAWVDLNLGDQTAGIEKLIAAQNTTAREAILAAVAGFDAETYLRDAGVTVSDVDALRVRLS